MTRSCACCAAPLPQQLIKPHRSLMALPEKPIIKSQSKTAQRYQRMLDHLADSAAAANWDAVRALRINESDNYAKVVMDYRQRLLLAALRQSQRSSGG
jgi:hypothetical protein